MTTPAAHETRRSAPPEVEERSWGLIAFVALLVVGVVAIVAALIFRSEPDFALVFAAPQDCLRAYSDAKCREIVARAVAIHGTSAPRYGDQRICELDYGEGECTPVAAMGGSFFAPGVAAIVIARGAIDDPAGMVPLYFGPPNSTAKSDDGRRVYYHGMAVGILRDKRFGGAPISVLTDLAGQPLTSDAVRRMRRS